MSNIERLRGASGAQRYRAMIADYQSRFWSPNTNKLCIPPEEFEKALRAGSVIAATGAKDVQTLFGYSSVRWDADYDGVAGQYQLLATNANVRRFFQYGVDDQNNVQALGGYPAGYAARWDDTNQVKAGRPPFGAMLIERIGLVLRHRSQNFGAEMTAVNDSDPVWAEMVLANMSLAIGTNGSKKLRHLGSPMFWTGHGGLAGDAVDSVGTAMSYATLGAPAGQTFVRELTEPFVWQAAGGVDDDLVIEARIDHDVLYDDADEFAEPMRFELWCVVEGRSAEDLSANGW